MTLHEFKNLIDAACIKSDTAKTVVPVIRYRITPHSLEYRDIELTGRWQLETPLKPYDGGEPLLVLEGV